MNKPRITLIAIGALLYLAGLAMPAWECTRMHDQLLGLDVLMTGFLGLLYLDPRWFCNAVVLMAVYSVFRPLKYGWLPFVLAGVATTTLLGPYFCGNGGGALGNGTGMGAGGYLWISSLWVMGTATCIRTPANTG